MKSIKIVLKLALTLVGSMFAGVLLLYLAFLVPTDPIYQHVREAGRVFRIEGTYPVMDGTNATILDNWTDALMLENAFFEKEGAGTLEKALGIYRPEFKQGVPTDSLMRYLVGETGYNVPSYARYWHGYLVVLKPLLTVTDYLGIRGINRIVQTVVVLAAAIVLWRKLSIRYVVPVLAVYLFWRPQAVAFSMQFSAIFYVSLLAAIIMALLYRKLAMGNRLLYFFLMVGIITNYVDFLTYPITALGIPLALWLCFERKRNCLDKIKGIMAYSACWGFGYFGMWIGKWVIGSFLLKRNVLADALEQARTRTSAEIGYEAISRSDVIMRNLSTGFANWGWLVGITLIVVIVIGLLKTKLNLKEFLLQSIPFLIVGIFPILWYGILSNHSYIHHWFTYRALSTSVFAVLGMGLSYYLAEKPETQIKSD